MNKDIFNFRRFGQYFASDIRTCTANYGLSLLTISLLTPIILHVLTVGISLIVNQVWDGPGIAARAAAFIAAMFCMMIIMPVKTYGKITEKQYGSQWLMVPASKLEKFLSMIILTCIVAPIIGVTIYLCFDDLLCALDHTCGDSILHELGNFQSFLAGNLDPNIDEYVEYQSVYNFVEQLTSPWLYIDDIIGIVLPFLLGALVFKNGKTVKTVLALCALSTLFGLISVPLMTDWLKTMTGLQTPNGDVADTLVIFDSWLFRNVALVDTISDTIFNAVLLTAIFFRIKTLKH